MKKYLYLSLCAVVLASCAKQTPLPSVPESVAVGWSVLSVVDYSTKALVESRELMERACTPSDKDYVLDEATVKGLGQTIGVWADYSVTIDGVKSEVKDVFAGTKLIYNPESGNSQSKWEYQGDPAYWVIGGQYVFRAYYPESELNVNRSLSNAKTLVIEMNTATTQRDMLLAHNSYDTVSGTDANGNKKGLSDPVELRFRHAMSAMKFVFKFYDGSDGVLFSQDAVTSCWMESDSDDSFAITGYMVYGNGLDYREGPIQWRNQYYPASGVKFYQWNCSEGVSFGNSRPSGTDVWDASKYQTVAVPYSRAGTAEGDLGEEFTRHDGWLVTIPQASVGRLRLYFKTKAGGDAVFSVGIPAVTGTSMEKYESDPSSPKDPAGKDWVPGYRYTYTVAISKTEASVSLSIAPWKRLDSSFDIKFN